MPLDGDAKPLPKSASLARGQRRYRRKVAGPKQWAAIIAEKTGPCRVCVVPDFNGTEWSKVEFHHVIPRDLGGDDLADNIVPLHGGCHRAVTLRDREASLALCSSLTDAEYAYAIMRGGEAVFERVYGIEYQRP